MTTCKFLRKTNSQRGSTLSNTLYLHYIYIQYYSAGLRAGFAPIKNDSASRRNAPKCCLCPFLSLQKVIIAGVIEIKGRGGEGGHKHESGETYKQ